MPIVFAVISPHPPIILPSVGSEKDRSQVKNTIEALEKTGSELKKLNLDTIIISSPHSDWGFQVPLSFLAKDFEGKIETVLTGDESPELYFEKGKKLYQELDKDKKYALIASGDLSHCLKKEGPYGYNPDGPEFDKELMESLKKRDIAKIMKLDIMYPEAGECGLRSICFMLGILEAAGADWQQEILSYEGPWGVGYLVARLK